MSQSDGPVLQRAGKGLQQGCIEVPSSTGREMAVGVWGHLRGEYSLPHVGAAGTALCPELCPLPGLGCAECVGRHTRVNSAQTLPVLAQPRLAAGILMAPRACRKGTAWNGLLVVLAVL